MLLLSYFLNKAFWNFQNDKPISVSQISGEFCSVCLPLLIACLLVTKFWLSFSSICFCSQRGKNKNLMYLSLSRRMYSIQGIEGEGRNLVMWFEMVLIQRRKPVFCTIWFSVYLPRSVSVHTLCLRVCMYEHVPCAVPVIRHSTDLWAAGCSCLAGFKDVHCFWLLKTGLFPLENNLGIGSFYQLSHSKKWVRLMAAWHKNNIENQHGCLPAAVLLAKCVCFVCIENSIVCVFSPELPKEWTVCFNRT